MSRRKVVIGIVTLAVAAFAGGAYAATTQTATPTRQAFLNDLAQRLHVSPAQLESAIKGAAQDQVDAAVKAGRLTQAQANALEQRLARLGLLGSLFGPGLLFGGPGGGGLLRAFKFPHAFPLPNGTPLPKAFAQPRGPGAGPPLAVPFFFGGLGGSLKAAASYLGLTKAQLRDDVYKGETLSQVAKSRGKSVAGLEQALLANIRVKFDAAVKAGRITIGQEQQLLSGLSKMIDRAVTGATFLRRAFARPGLRGQKAFRGAISSAPSGPGAPPTARLFAPAPPSA